MHGVSGGLQQGLIYSETKDASRSCGPAGYTPGNGTQGSAGYTRENGTQGSGTVLSMDWAAWEGQDFLLSETQFIPITITWHQSVNTELSRNWLQPQSREACCMAPSYDRTIAIA